MEDSEARASLQKRGELVIPRKLVGDVPLGSPTDRTTLLKGDSLAKRLVRDLFMNFAQSFCCEKEESMMRVPPPCSASFFRPGWGVASWLEEGGKKVCVAKASKMFARSKSDLGCRGEREGGGEFGDCLRVCLRKSVWVMCIVFAVFLVVGLLVMTNVSPEGCFSDSVRREIRERGCD
jgi:hypothetical protein